MVSFRDTPEKTGLIVTVLRLIVIGYLFYCVGAGMAILSLEKFRYSVESSEKISRLLREEVLLLKKAVRVLEGRLEGHKENYEAKKRKISFSDS